MPTRGPDHIGVGRLSGFLGVCLSLLAACSARIPEMTDDGRGAERQRMVEQQLQGRDIRSQTVLDAMARVPRHRFVPAEEQAGAYHDFPLPIGFGQTISQPYIVAFMTQALDV